MTDHKPLIWFKNSTDPTSRVSRWRIKLNAYDFDIVYKAGKTNVNADALSRNPVDNILVVQTRSKAGKINIPNYHDKRPTPINTKNKVFKDSLEVLQENENEPGEIVSNYKEIENSYPDINFQNENETLEQFNEKLLDNHQNNSIINNKIDAQTNDQTQTAVQISAKENILSSPRVKFNYGKLFVESKEQLLCEKIITYISLQQRMMKALYNYQKEKNYRVFHI